jgi:small-conductance mechanosensitive channel
MVAWLIVLGIFVAVPFGYSALATFLTDQLATLSILASMTFLAMQLSQAVFAQLLRPETRLFRSIQSASGLSRQSLEQLAVILSGLTQLLILGLCLTFALAPWRVDSGDILMPLRAVIFGFTIGDVTISFGAALFAIVLLGAGILFTRGIQRWLTRTYLPHTGLDAGLRNSIVTGVGYLGFIISIAVGLSALGLSLEKVTIVAGALSVGIGFGLQSIVNNFVSGLILLWERGIRVGDWIVVGDEQGLVKRINVRATEIETFDRSILIVPNSSLVSGTVKNRVHNDRTGRVVVSVPVARHADPDLVIALIGDVAKANQDLLLDPAPAVYFRKLGEAVKEFELICFIADVDLTGKVGSDLLLAIDIALRAKGLGEIVHKTLLVHEGAEHSLSEARS